MTAHHRAARKPRLEGAEPPHDPSILQVRVPQEALLEPDEAVGGTDQLHENRAANVRSVAVSPRAKNDHLETWRKEPR